MSRDRMDETKRLGGIERGLWSTWAPCLLVVMATGACADAASPDTNMGFPTLTGGGIVTGGVAGTGGVMTGGSISSGGNTVVDSTGGVLSTGGVSVTGGDIVATGGIPVDPATGGVAATGGDNGTVGMGTCCSSGDCLCHGPVPSALSTSSGPFATASYSGSTGTIYYPTDAEPPFAGVAICAGFTNLGPEMETWGPFYASYGIVTVITATIGTDTPDIRATKLLAAVDEMKQENDNSSSPLYGLMSGRYGTSGYSMGGGGTTIASGTDPSLRTSVGLAAWGGVGTGVTVPTLLLCGDADTVAACSMSDSVYTAIPDSTPKMEIVIPGATHFNWFDPADGAGMGTSGKYALAFQKVFLEGDERWKPLLVQKPSGGSQTTNIQ